MGIGLALDDFGRGESSLSFLRRVTIDQVEIDRTFVAELPGNASDGALKSAIIVPAHGLQLDVVAERVETEARARFLELRACDELQVHPYRRSCVPEKLVDRLRAQPATAGIDVDGKPDHGDESGASVLLSPPSSGPGTRGPSASSRVPGLIPRVVAVMMHRRGPATACGARAWKASRSPDPTIGTSTCATERCWHACSRTPRAALAARS